MDGLQLLGSQVEVLVEVPRGGRVKRDEHGRWAFASPIGAPFSYGCVPSLMGGDGDALDALVVGHGLRRGERVFRTVYGVVQFVDAGQVDQKLICGLVPPSLWTRAWVAGLFRAYPWVKRTMYALQGVRGRTETEGVVWWNG